MLFFFRSNCVIPLKSGVLKVCGSVLSEPCTPLRCDADQLCPPEATPPCEQGQKCVGALPLAKKADSDAKGVKDRLDKLTKKITDTAEKVAEGCHLEICDKSTNQSRMPEITS